MFKVYALYLFFCLLFGFSIFKLVITLIKGIKNITIFDKFFFGGITFFIILFLYGYYIEPLRVEQKQVVIETPKIQTSDEITIVQISDLHSPSNLVLEHKLDKLISNINPDIIVFTGDLANKEKGIANAQNVLRQLSQIAPVYVIRGDNDDEREDLFTNTNCIELHGDGRTIKIKNTTVYISGWSLQADWRNIYTTLRKRDKELFTIFLSHSPDYFNDISNWGADLQLSGHTHGGQISLPYYGAIWTASLYGKKYEAGLYKKDTSYLYINRGIGEADFFPQIRLFARPEITSIIIKRKI